MARVSFIFLGCPKNQVDLEVIAADFGKKGFILTPKIEESDICLISTCAFIKSARLESYRLIRRMLSLKERKKIKKVIVFGCLVEKERERLLEKYPSVDFFVGLGNLNKIPEILKDKTKFQLASLDKIDLPHPPRLILTPYAYIKIADGCNNFCAYCTIPKIRGCYRSRPIEDIVDETEEIANLGVKEIILVAQDTTLYGFDLYGKPSLDKLLKKLAKVRSIEWIRVLYTHPAHYSLELIRVIASEEKIVKYLDIPIQHSSDRILKLMNRPYKKSDILTLIEKLRAVEGMVLRTTIIVGFPTETEEDFSCLLRFINEVRFEHLGCFIYSEEKETKAREYHPKVSYLKKKERHKIIMEKGKEISYSIQRSLVGHTFKVLIEGEDKNKGYNYFGRTYRDAPEIDGLVYLKGAGLKLGEFYSVKITDALPYDLFGTLDL